MKIIILKRLNISLTDAIERCKKTVKVMKQPTTVATVRGSREIFTTETLEATNHTFCSMDALPSETTWSCVSGGTSLCTVAVSTTGYRNPAEVETTFPTDKTTVSATPITTTQYHQTTVFHCVNGEWKKRNTTQRQTTVYQRNHQNG
jgi:hypothetical protein